MKATLENTSKIVNLEIDGATVPARIWEGTTENGVPFHAYIVRVAVHKAEDNAEFERDLREERAPSPAIQAIPLRFFLD